MIFHDYPYTNFHDLNLDWILRKMQELDKEMDDFIAVNKITWAGEWDGSKTYPRWAIVQDTDGNGYISVQPVPANVPLDNEDYWVKVADYDSLYAAFDQRISAIESLITSATLVSPMDYGAVGDGVTDDSAAVHVASEHGMIFDRLHTFYCESPVTIENGSIFTSYILKEDQPIRCNGRLFIGNDVTSDGTFSPVRGNYLLNMFDIESAVIAFNKFHDAKNAVHLTGCHDAIVTHNTFKGFQQTNSNGYGIVTNDCNRILIDSNIFKAVDRHCIYISHEGENTGSYDVVISNNTIDLAGTVNMTETAFPIQTRNVHRCHIHGNTVRNAQGFVWIVVDDMSNDGSDNIEINNNTIMNISAPSGREHLDGCISISKDGNPANLVDGLRIHDNIFRTNDVIMAKLSWADDVHIENNVFKSSANYAVRIEYGSGKMFTKGLYINGNNIAVSSVGVVFYILDTDDIGSVHINNNDLTCAYIFGTNVSAFTEGFDTLEISDNRYTSPNYREFLNAVPIDKLIIRGNSGNIGKYVNGSPAALETDNRYNTIAFLDSAASVQALTESVASSSPYWINNGYEKNNFKLLSRYYSSVSALPTSDLIYGQIAITNDSHAYIWIGDSWLQLG